jgi:hypothetical protein
MRLFDIESLALHIKLNSSCVLLSESGCASAVAMISSVCSANSEGGRNTPNSSDAVSAEDVVVSSNATLVKLSAIRLNEGHIGFEKAILSISNDRTNELRPWRGGSPRRNTTICDCTSPITLKSPAKKCYGAPHLSTSKKFKGDSKKSLAELSKVTKFPMASTCTKTPMK